jgi:Transposase DDE domain
VSDGFKSRHRRGEADFTRVRRLDFGMVTALVLRNSLKSLQLVANEAMSWLGHAPVTASAYSQARHKLKHTAFIELNQRAVVDVMYSDADYRTFWGFRVLAVDGSKVVLPDRPEVCDEFGTIAWSGGKDSTVEGEKPYALTSVLYDVLNRVALDAALAPAKAYEVDLAVAHLSKTAPGDLLVMDRNYPSYRMLAEMQRHGRDFVVRCSAASFAEARRMLKGQGPDSQCVRLTPCTGQQAEIRRLGLPLSLTVRFVRVCLSTGEHEVLVTSLLDEDTYPTEGFLALYRWRWGVETFFGLLKTRLGLENFTGKSVEAVRQDLYATVYLSGLESILTADAQAHLDAKETRHAQTVNRAVSFHAIKSRTLDLLLGDRQNNEALLEQLTAVFLTNPCLDRPKRNPPRKKTATRTLLSFHKRQKKVCF